MVQIIDGADLASYPGVTSSETELEELATRASDLVMEKWAPTPEVAAQVPPKAVENIAIDAALRVYWNPKGLQSWTRAVHDASRTERASVSQRAGLHLTAEELAELAQLRGIPRRRRRAVGSIRLHVPGR